MSTILFARRRWCIPSLWWTLAFALTLSGCATPVGVEHVDIQTVYHIETASALSEAQPSEFTKILLRRLGLLDRFDTEPAYVLAELHQRLSPQG